MADATATLTELAPFSLGVRVEKAEAAVSRVRALADRWAATDPDGWVTDMHAHVAARQLNAALDGTDQTEGNSR